MLRCTEIVLHLLYLAGLQVMVKSECQSGNLPDQEGLGIACSGNDEVLITWDPPFGSNNFLQSLIIEYLCYKNLQDSNNVKLYEEFKIQNIKSQFSTTTNESHCVVKGCIRKISMRQQIYQSLKNASCSFSNGQEEDDNDSVSLSINSSPAAMSKLIMNSTQLQPMDLQTTLPSSFTSYTIISSHVIVEGVITTSIASTTPESNLQLEIAMYIGLTVAFIVGLLILIVVILFSLTGFQRRKKSSIQLKFTDATVCSITIMPASASDISIKTFVTPLNFSQPAYIEHVPSISDTTSVVTIDNTILDEVLCTENAPSVFDDTSSGNMVQFTGREILPYNYDPTRTSFLKSTSDSSGSYIDSDIVSSSSPDVGYIPCA